MPTFDAKKKPISRAGQGPGLLATPAGNGFKKKKSWRWWVLFQPGMSGHAGQGGPTPLST